MKKFLIICFSFFLASGTALADVQITIKGDKGRNSTFSSNGEMARIEDKQMPGYVIIDYASGDFYMVDTERGEIMRTSVGKGGVAVNESKISINLKDKGDGQTIAGYSTRKFEMIANGETCGTIYASSKLLKNNEVRAIFDSMRSMQQFSRNMTRGMRGMSVCQQANLQLADMIESSGAPMRMLDQNGNLLSEVVAVDTKKKFAASHYALPPGMKVVDMSDKMNQAEQETQQMMENMPDMGELMKQIQQGGGQMTEEMQQQMQQMMKQLQQQSQ
jgi:hypothetical protein